LVEGLDDKHSVIHLLRRHGFDWDDQHTIRPFVDATDGIDALLEAIPVAAKGSYERLGVVVDADDSFVDRSVAVRDRLMAAGLQSPVAPHPAGTIIEGIRPRAYVGVWLMPDNSTEGRLENFLERLIPPSDVCWPLAREVTRAAKERGCPVRDNLKSSLHTWLAWQETPGLPFGTALLAKLFQHDSPEALAFVDWFRRLFPTVNDEGVGVRLVG